jgi:nucleotide-binding universal stress UspA family protein
MVNILIPTDLSELSKIAVHYAISIANRLGGTLTLLHVVSIIQPTRATMRLQLRSLEKELLIAAREDLEGFVNSLSEQVKTAGPMRMRVVKGSSFNDTVKKEAKKLHTGLIVMGTRGASGLKKYVLGSNTASVIEVSHVPVLAVPELAVFKGFTNVVYATDLLHAQSELKMLIPYLQMFGSTIHLLHITPSLKEVSMLEKKIEAVVANEGIKNVVVKVIVNKEVDEAIEYYVKESKADLLAMFDRSMTRKMAFQSKIPLLAFRRM